MMADHGDTALIHALQSGNEDAFNELYERYYRLVYFIAYELTRSDADAKDILQDTFLQVRRSIHSLQDTERFKPWLNRIVINKCKNLFRSRRHVDLDQDDLWYQYHVNEERRYMLPEANLHERSDQRIIHEMLGRLSITQREVLIMRYFQHMSMKEMAEVLEVPEGTVKTRLMYGKNHLKKMILDYEAANDTKLDFHLEGASLSLLFLHLYEQGMVTPAPLLLPKLKWRTNYNNAFLNGACVVLSTAVCGFATMAYLAFQDARPAYANNVSQHQTLSEKQKDREFYFTLMDWACCKEDMKLKGKDDFEQIFPLYEQLRQSGSRYYDRLVAEHWVADFEMYYEHSY